MSRRWCSRRRLPALVLFALGAGVVVADPTHHPGAGAPSATSIAGGTAAASPMVPQGATASAPAAVGMAGGEMAGMMDRMTAPMSPIYPSLMTLPALTPEKRAEIDALARRQVDAGSAQLASGYEALGRATREDDHAAMQQAVGLMREALDQLGAGIAARRVLSEGKAPRNLALGWFKREMNLASAIARDQPRGLLGVPLMHAVTMVLLAAFVLGMVAMNFFKMRRAADLYGRREGGSGTPPPGSSPPLAATPTPPAT